MKVFTNDLVIFSSSQMWVMPFILLNSLVAAVMMVAACMISVGFDKTCSSFEDITKKTRFFLFQLHHVFPESIINLIYRKSPPPETIKIFSPNYLPSLQGSSPGSEKP